MTDLTKTPAWPFDDIVHGETRLRAAPLGRLTSVSPYRGQTAALSERMEAAHGLRFPEANCVTVASGAQAIWFGRETAMLAGPMPDPALAERAALTDQSDAWASVALSGPDSAQVLARLVPIDLRDPAFPKGATARTLLGHLNVSISRLQPDDFVILVFRSMARTLHHDLTKAMASLAARR